ncbi:MAG: hypothetical protein AAFN10_28095 [Bacteroidota bacterium]
MLSPKWNKILLPLVLLVWVGVALRFMDGCGDSPANTTSSRPSIALIPLDSMEQQALYKLQLNYRDPFLDKAPIIRPSNSLPKRSTSKLAVVENPNKKKLPLPAVVYKGGVQGVDGAEMTGILFLKNKPFTIRAGDELAGMKIVQLDMHSLQISFSDSLYTLLSE